ncbi:MAG: hypothetical protein FWD36_03350 [Treponema sp.]|nr:hypothetical protein [Treponema sp.]
MSTHITRYKTKNGKTSRAPCQPAKAEKDGSSEIKTGEIKNNQPATPARQGA